MCPTPGFCAAVYDEEDGAVKVAAPGAAGAHAAGTKEYLEALEDKRAIKINGKSTFVGLIILVCAGISYGVFSPAFNLASNDQWHKLDPGVPHLVIYTAFFYFSTGFFVLAFMLNLTFLYFPPFGLPKSSIGAWISDWPNRHWALLAGVICGLGNTFQFMGGQAAGYAAADSVQALPLVSTFWGVILFGEYRKSSKRTYLLLAGMLCMFAAAVGLLMGSSGHRKAD
jgi:glucose uptake protein GlcU